MDFHAITWRSAELLFRVVDGQLVIVPPPTAPAAAAPAQPAPGK